MCHPVSDTIVPEFRRRLGYRERVEASFLLWRATQDGSYLEAAHGLLRHFREHAPEQSRDTLIGNVPFHREIMAAWEEHGAAG